MLPKAQTHIGLAGVMDLTTSIYGDGLVSSCPLACFGVSWSWQEGG